jgi:hypothetical protein
MGLYRATINQPEAKVGKTVELDDSDRQVQLRVAHKHLVPVDDVAIKYQKELVVVEAPATNADAIKAALAAARAQADAEEVESAPALVSFAPAPARPTVEPVPKGEPPVSNRLKKANPVKEPD